MSRTLYVLCLNRWHIDDLYVALVARPTVYVARWLWQTVDVRGIDRACIGVGYQTDTTGQALRKIDPRLLQQQTTVIVVWVVAAIGLLYWLAR